MAWRINDHRVNPRIPRPLVIAVREGPSEVEAVAEGSNLRRKRLARRITDLCADPRRPWRIMKLVKEESIKEQFEVEMPGFSKAFNRNSTVWCRFLWLLISLGLYSFCCYQLADSILEFYGEPIKTSSYYIYNQTIDFPTLIVCKDLFPNIYGIPFSNYNVKYYIEPLLERKFGTNSSDKIDNLLQFGNISLYDIWDGFGEDMDNILVMHFQDIDREIHFNITKFYTTTGTCRLITAMDKLEYKASFLEVRVIRGFKVPPNYYHTMIKLEETVELAIWQQQQELTAKSFNAMRKNGFLTDLTISCGGKDLAVHRTLLCAASPLFEAMFKSECKESLSGRMDLPTIPLQVAEMVLDFIYTGRISNIQQDREKLKCLLEASHLLQLNLLFQYCLQELSKMLSATYFLELWQLANLYEDIELQKNIASFLAKNFFEASSTDDFSKLDVSELLQIIQNPDTESVPVDIILDGILMWINYNRGERECEYERLLAVMDIEKISDELLNNCLEDALERDCSSIVAILHAEMRNRFAEKFEQKLLFFHIGEANNVMNTYNVNEMTWSHPITLPSQLMLNEYMAVTVFKRNVYFIGGFEGGTEIPSAKVYKYSPLGNNVIRIQDLKVGVCGVGATELDDSIYVIGGAKGYESTSAVQQLNIVKRTAEVLSSTNTQHLEPVVFSYKKHLYLTSISLWDDDRRVFEKYDPINDQWSVIFKLPRGLDVCSPTIWDERVFMACWEDYGFTWSIYDLNSGKWNVIKTALSPDQISTVWVTNENRIIATDSVETIHMYSINENKWQEGIQRGPVQTRLVALIK